MKHGMYLSREYSSWSSMIKRCTRKYDPSYSGYGGRGITICKRWMEFKNFLLDMGKRPPNTTLDRINNESGYRQGNCRWATGSEQQKNKRPFRWKPIIINGEIMKREWSEARRKAQADRKGKPYAPRRMP